MTQRQADNLDAVRAWIFPILLAVVGFLIVFIMNQTMKHLEDIENSQMAMQDEFRKAIEDVRRNQDQSQYQLKGLQEDLEDLKKKLTIK